MNTMQNFTLFHADCVECQFNKLYPHKVVVNDPATLKGAVSHDYVGAEYKDNERSNNNFISSDCVIMDTDNTHSDNPEDWVTPELIARVFPEVAFAVHYSRNHMKEKDGKAPRPKFHAFFPISLTNSAQEYSELKKRILQLCPFFDSNAADAGRMFFGTLEPQVNFFEGTITIEDFLNSNTAPSTNDILSYRGSITNVTASPISVGKSGEVISQGMRNTTLFKFACRSLVRFGDTDETRYMFWEKSKHCFPPLPCNEVASIWNNALKFYSDVVLKDPKYSPPTAFNRGYVSLEPTDRSDVGQAQVLTKEYNNKLRYSPATGFLNFNDVLWEESDDKARTQVHELTERQLRQSEERETKASEIITLLKGMFKQINLDVETIKPPALQKYEAEYEKAQQFHKFALKYRDSYRISATLTEAKSELSISLDKLDADPFLLNTTGGTYDLRFGLSKSHAHNPEDLITKCTAVAPSYNGMDIWLNFLQTIFLNDQELIDYVQLIAGLSAIGRVFLEAVIICIGSGRNGKSTLWNAIKRVMGSYAGTISADVLTANCRRNIKPELADLRGKRLIVASELEEGATLSTSTLKQLASTDTIKAERKYRDPFEFIPSHTTILLTNYLPEIPSGVHSKGTWRRLVVIPFNAEITPSQDVKNYADVLFEQAGGAILTWIIEGAQKIINKNYHFDIPQAVEYATGQYKEDNDWLQNFITECCEVGKEFTVKPGEFHSSYKKYCEHTGEMNKKPGVINDALKAAGYRRQKNRDGTVIKGLRLRSTVSE